MTYQLSTVITVQSVKQLHIPPNTTPGRRGTRPSEYLAVTGRALGFDGWRTRRRRRPIEANSESVEQRRRAGAALPYSAGHSFILCRSPTGRILKLQQCVYL